MPTVLGRDDRGNVIDIDMANYGGDAGPHNHDAAYEPAGAVDTHAATPHGGEAGPHTHDEYATDADLTTHAGTAHGTQAHAISGVLHTGTLDHSALGTVTPNQHHNENHASRHASAGADAVSPASIGAAASGHDHDAAYAAISHGTHLSLGTTAGTAAEGNHAHAGGGGEAFPVGSVFLSIVATDPTTLLGYGTWAAFGAGRMLIGNDGASFGTDEATGGSSTHTHAAHTGVVSHTHPITDPGHVHDEYLNSTTTGGLTGQGARDTSTNNPSLLDYDTGSSTTGISLSAPVGAVSELTHDSPNHLPPYVVVHMWKRTA